MTKKIFLKVQVRNRGDDSFFFFMVNSTGVGEGTSGTSIEVPVVGTLKLLGH